MVSSTVGSDTKIRLEPARQRGVLFHMLAVFVRAWWRRCNADRPAPTPVEQVGGVHRAVGLAAPIRVCISSHEQDDAALGRGYFLQHGLQPLLELAAIFRAARSTRRGRARAASCPEAFRHVAIENPQRQPLDDRGLADPGFADQHRIVLVRRERT